MTAGDPKVSVVIAAYQAGRTIEAALQSVFGQSVGPDEIVVVDDGSSDHTPARIASTIANAGHVKHLRLTENRGVASALNFGIERCTGDILMFLDADDLWETNKVAVQVGHLRDRPYDAAVFGQSAEFRDRAAILDLAGARAIRGSIRGGPQKGAMAIWRDEFLRFLDWLTRANSMALRTSSHPEIVLYRRVHGKNMGIEHREEQSDQYLGLMRSISRRRRASQINELPATDEGPGTPS
jgi:glycosyltransferase involved in cell wall biosynthesis